MRDCDKHILIDGLGMYGDALTCIKCGFTKYPEVLQRGFLLKHTVLDSKEYPWLIDAADKAIEHNKSGE